MKKKKLPAKLQLNKIAITELNVPETQRVKGGDQVYGTDDCLIPHSVFFYVCSNRGVHPTRGAGTAFLR